MATMGGAYAPMAAFAYFNAGKAPAPEERQRK
jgi:hypothetical protein